MKAEPASRAWQPLTFGGVARYAQDWIGRLVVACLVVALFVAAAVVWTARRAWAPVIDDSIARLPAGAEIRGGRMQAPQPVRLAENAFLSIQLDPTGGTRLPSSADLQITLAQYEIRFRSLFGVSAAPYPKHWTVLLNPSEMEPKWGAWRPAALAYLGAGTVLFLFVNWGLLGALYAVGPLLIAKIARRELGIWGSWKLSVAALMPGAIFMTMAIILYGLGNLRLAEMIVAAALHFAVGWIFLIGGALSLPRKCANPFLESREHDANTGEDSPLEGYEDSQGSTESSDSD